MKLKAGGFALIISVAATVIVVSSSIAFVCLSDPNYKEGFGKDATGGAGNQTYIVTSSAATGPGSFLWAVYANWTGLAQIHDLNIVFAVDTFTTNDSIAIGSNVTIDGCANGKNGVIFDHGGVGDVNGMPSQPPAKRALLLPEGTNNVVIRCLNFIGYGYPNIAITDPAHAQPEYNFIWIVPGAYAAAGTVSNVLVDRCTFTRSTNKAFDITGSENTGTVTNITFQRNLLHDNALGSLVKYADHVRYVKRNISYHHNVFTRGGERHPQVVDAIGPFDYVNNVVNVNAGDVTNYPDGTIVSPYGLRIWNTSLAGNNRRGGASADPTFGNVIINVVSNAFVGDRGTIIILTDNNIPNDPAPATNAYNYLASNYCAPSGNCPASPTSTPISIPLAYQVTTLAVDQLKSHMLPHVGAPNRTALDQQRIDEAAAVLSGSGTPPAPPTQ